ncbi:MAG: nucleotide disphospho-sugar-binding domain-containing protein, partial [Verrucomicrobiota bacterium]
HYRALAAKHDIPFATFAFCHNLLPTTDYPPEGTPPLHNFPMPLQRRWNGMLWRLANKLVDITINSVAGKLFVEKGLGQSQGFLTKPADLCLVAVSRELMGGIEHDPRFQFCGYLRWQSPENPKMGKEIEDFCQGQRVPVMTFGSVAFDDTHTIMSRFLKNWPKGKPIIIQSGWAGLSVELERPEIKVVPSMSHDQLFRYASLVIHHGGAGTTASVLHAGIPHIIIPHIADQQWWGTEIVKLKVGLYLSKRKWPVKLSGYVKRVERNTAMHERAKTLAGILADENGGRISVHILEEYVRSRAVLPSKGKKGS